MSHADHTRDPCPWVILNDFGGAFAMGAIGGGIWHGIKGARNSPRGDRFVGAVSTIKARAPVTGGNFGVWGGMFSTFDCAVKGYRQKEDAWNAIISVLHRYNYYLPDFETPHSTCKCCHFPCVLTVLILLFHFCLLSDICFFMHGLT
ncbi:hypothetical protein RSAG8_01890, partial [Rhizoctonia solani AG-8 WAC10335]